MICQAPFYPNRGNYMTDHEHDGNAHKSWFLVLRAGLFTKKTDTEHQADISGCPIFTFRTRAEAEAQWAAHCSQTHPHGCENDAGHNDEGSEDEDDPSRPSSPPPFLTPARSAPRSTPRTRSTPANAVRASVKREAPVKDEVKEAKTPLFWKDGKAHR
ncbi:hypothetical protein B0H14DRAFT_3464160 [Mycena olivaceomarginata]|nr:hypothetical protein B0H14DRAFT_3464160 [Mycena olivaceomarginata]